MPIVNAKAWTIENVIVKTIEEEIITLESCKNIQLPEIEKTK